MRPTDNSADRDELLSLVSHEMKNPLTSIAGFTMFAEDAVRNHDQELALESLQVVRAEAERVLRLAEDLLDIAQVSAGRFSIKVDSVDLKEVVKGIAGRYAAITGRQIEAVAVSGFPCVLGDAVRLAQVIENLVSNATKYSPKNEAIIITMYCSASSVTVSVWNDGPAIPPEQLPLIFKRFSRLGNGDGDVKGSGLGLYISQQIVELHGGTIDVISREGQGTCFRVELPRRVN